MVPFDLPRSMLGSERSKKEADPLGRSVVGKIFRVKRKGEKGDL